jgi:hypothetical protein
MVDNHICRNMRNLKPQRVHERTTTYNPVPGQPHAINMLHCKGKQCVSLFFKVAFMYAWFPLLAVYWRHLSGSISHEWMVNSTYSAYLWCSLSTWFVNSTSPFLNHNKFIYYLYDITKMAVYFSHSMTNTWQLTCEILLHWFLLNWTFW